mgnify:CR=1 FL=1
MNGRAYLLRECMGGVLIFIFFLSIYALSRIPSSTLVIIFIFLAVLSYLITAKYFLREVGIKRFRDIFNREVLEKYDKEMRKEISYVLIYGLLCVVMVFLYLMVLISLVVPVSAIPTHLRIVIFVLTIGVTVFLAIVLTIGTGFIRELPKYIGEKKYVIPFSVLAKWIGGILLGVVSIGAPCLIIGISLVLLFEKIGLEIPTFVLAIIFIPLFFGLYLRFMNKFSLPLLSWVEENVKCPRCGGRVSKTSMSVSRFHLIELTIQCQKCNKIFKLGTGPLGRTLYIIK